MTACNWCADCISRSWRPWRLSDQWQMWSSEGPWWNVVPTHHSNRWHNMQGTYAQLASSRCMHWCHFQWDQCLWNILTNHKIDIQRQHMQNIINVITLLSLVVVLRTSNDMMWTWEQPNLFRVSKFKGTSSPVNGRTKTIPVNQTFESCSVSNKALVLMYSTCPLPFTFTVTIGKATWPPAVLTAQLTELLIWVSTLLSFTTAFCCWSFVSHLNAHVDAVTEPVIPHTITSCNYQQNVCETPDNHNTMTLTFNSLVTGMSCWNSAQRLNLWEPLQNSMTNHYILGVRRHIIDR